MRFLHVSAVPFSSLYLYRPEIKFRLQHQCVTPCVKHLLMQPGAQFNELNRTVIARPVMMQRVATTNECKPVCFITAHLARNDLVAHCYSETSPCSSLLEQQGEASGAALTVRCATTDDEFSRMSLFRSPFILYTATVQIPENVHIASVLQSFTELGSLPLIDGALSASTALSIFLNRLSAPRSHSA